VSDPPAVLDASALLALLQNEPGAEVAAVRLPDCVISAVSLSEVVAKLVDYGLPEADLRAALDVLDLEVREFDTEAAYAAGELRRITRRAGLSLGDCACLALAMRLGAAAGHRGPRLGGTRRTHIAHRVDPLNAAHRTDPLGGRGRCAGCPRTAATRWAEARGPDRR
jgi:ribonuclease VapC